MVLIDLVTTKSIGIKVCTYITLGKMFCLVFQPISFWYRVTTHKFSFGTR